VAYPVNSALKETLMHAVVRPYATAGIALIGASVVAVTPVPVPPVRAEIEHAAVRVTTAVDPFDAYTRLFQDTNANLQSILETAATNGPAPILSTVLKNQITALQEILKLLSPPARTRPDTTGSVATQSLTHGLADARSSSSAPAASVGLAVSGLGDIDVEAAVNSLLLSGFAALYPLAGLLEPVIGGAADALQSLVAAIDRLGPLATIAANPIQNVVNVLRVLNEGYSGLAPTNAAVALGGLLGPVITTVAASAAAAQHVIDAAKDGSPGAVLTAVLDAPAVVVGGLLNGGYGPDLSSVIDTGLGQSIPLYAGGLLTPFTLGLNGDQIIVHLAGTLPALQTLQNLIAGALKPPTASKTAAPTLSSSTEWAPTPMTSVPSITPATVTLSTDNTGSALEAPMGANAQSATGASTTGTRTDVVHQASSETTAAVNESATAAKPPSSDSSAANGKSADAPDNTGTDTGAESGTADHTGTSVESGTADHTGTSVESGTADHTGTSVESGTNRHHPRSGSPTHAQFGSVMGTPAE
jgi:hypothetical protein